MESAEPAPVVQAPTAPKTALRRSSTGALQKWLAAALLALALTVSVGVRLRLLDFPLERDEGEYAYAGQLIQQGIPPYLLAYNMKMPGTYLAYAAIMAVFGQTTPGIHLGLLVVHLATLVLLFLLAKRYCGVLGAAAAVSAYALMSLSPSLLGLAAHATHFVVLPALAGLLLVQLPGERGRIWICLAAGICFGLAFLMKQPGMFLGIFGGLYLNYLELQKRPVPHGKIAFRLVSFALGCIVPFLGICVWLKAAGVFPQFWHWTIEYASAYASLLSFQDGLANLKVQFLNMFYAAPVLWLIGGAGLFVAAGKLASGNRVFLFGFPLFAFVSACPGLYFRNHYFIPFLPALCLLIGLSVRWLSACMDRMKFEASGQVFTAALTAAACAQSLFNDREVLFSLSPREACRAVYFLNPFPEAPEIAKYIQDHTGKDETIAVLGSEPEIYFDADRHSATGYIYTYPLMENQPYAVRMQEEMIQEIEKAKPSYIVFVSIAPSWLASDSSSRQILGWFNDYRVKYLEPVGLFQPDVDGQFHAVWGPAAATTKLRSQFSITVYKRLAEPGSGAGAGPAASSANPH